MPSSSRALPALPNLQFLRKTAKERLRSLRAQSPGAKLADAQLAVAREYGFASWRKLKDHVESVAATNDAAPDPYVASLPEHRRTHKIVQWKPLMDAAFCGDVARARRLLAGGADPNVVSTTPHRYRPLHRAIEQKKTSPRGKRHEDVVRLLLENGADPKLRATYFDVTALQLAAMGEWRFVPILRLYFEPLDIFHAIVLADERRVGELIRNDRGLARAKDTNGWSIMHYCTASAAHKNDAGETLVRIAELLLKHGADPMAPYMFGKWPIPPLYHCCGAHNNASLAEVLMKAGASPCDGETVYHASEEAHDECLAVIEKYADPKLLARECSKCLASQLHWGHSKGVAWLLAHGADPNQVHPHWGDSALHAAVKQRRSDKIIRMLLEHGADPKLKNRDGMTSINLARKSKAAARVLALLQKKGGRR